MLVTMLCLAATMHIPDSKWVMTFHDEFEGKAGIAPSDKVWSRDLGGGGFGNNELESYTDGNSNAFLDGKGNLIIEAREESTTGKDGIRRNYSSARLKTDRSFQQMHGRVEARMKLPKGQGIWPAFWMLGANIGQAGWPKCGEIDIMEMIGKEPNTVHGTIHGPGYSGQAGKGHPCEMPAPVSDTFHVYAVEWDEKGIRWFVDDKQYGAYGPSDVKPNAWVFDQPFFIILNLAVGGYWPGNPDATSKFPQRLLVDYVRVYKEKV